MNPLPHLVLLTAACMSSAVLALPQDNDSKTRDPAPSSKGSASTVPAALRPVVTPGLHMSEALSRNATGIYRMATVRFPNGTLHQVYALVVSGNVREAHVRKGAAWLPKRPGSVTPKPVSTTTFDSLMQDIGVDTNVNTADAAKKARFAQLMGTKGGSPLTLRPETDRAVAASRHVLESIGRLIVGDAQAFAQLLFFQATVPGGSFTWSAAAEEWNSSGAADGVGYRIEIFGIVIIIGGS